MNNKGQTILAEYVIIFFVVIAAAVAMTAYVRRGFEARIHDARNFAFTSVMSSGACDANCLMATGGSIYTEYEPYYLNMASNIGHNEAETDAAGQGNAQVLGAIYYKTKNEANQTGTTGSQLPPCAAGPNGFVTNAECS